MAYREGYYERAARRAAWILKGIEIASKEKGTWTSALATKLHKANANLVDFAKRARSNPSALTRTEWLIASQQARGALKDFAAAAGKGFLADLKWSTHVQDTVEGQKIYNAQVKVKTPAPKGQRRGKVERMKPREIQQLRNQVLNNIKRIDQFTKVGSDTAPWVTAADKALLSNAGLRAELRTMADLAPDSTPEEIAEMVDEINKEARKLENRMKKGHGKYMDSLRAAEASRMDKQDAIQKENVQTAFDEAKAKVVEERPGKKKTAPKAEKKAAPKKAPKKPAAEKKTAPKKGGKRKGGKAPKTLTQDEAIEKLKGMSESDFVTKGKSGSPDSAKRFMDIAKKHGFKTRGARSALGAHAKANGWKRVTAQWRKASKANKAGGALEGYWSASPTDTISAEAPAARAQVVEERVAREPAKRVRKKKQPKVKAQDAPTPEVYASDRAKATAQRNSPAGMREQAADLDANAKRAKGRNSKAEAKEMRKEAKRLRALANEVESGQLTPKETKPKAKPKAKAKAKAQPEVKAAPEVKAEPEKKPAAKPKPKPKTKPGPTPNQLRAQKAAATRALRKDLNEELAKGHRRAAHAKGVATKAGKARAEAAGRAKRSAASRKGSVKTENLRKAYIAEGLTPEQARSKAGRETVNLMREVEGKKGIWEGSKTPHKGKVSKAARHLLDLDTDAGPLKGSADVKALQKGVTGGKADVFGKGGNVATRAQRVAGKIPPSVLKGLAKTLRFAGPVGAVAEAARMGYNVTTKGLVQAMRDENITVAGKSRAEMEEIHAKEGAPTMPITRERRSAVRMAMHKAEKEGKSPVGMQVGTKGNVEKVTAAEVRAVKHAEVKSRKTRAATSRTKDTSTWAKEQKAKNAKAKEAPKLSLTERMAGKFMKGAKAGAEKEAKEQRAKAKAARMRADIAARKKRRFNVPASKVKSTWDKAKGQKGKFLARELEKQQGSQADKQAVATRRTLKAMRGRGPTEAEKSPTAQRGKHGYAMTEEGKARQAAGKMPAAMAKRMDEQDAMAARMTEKKKADERKRRLLHLQGQRFRR